MEKSSRYYDTPRVQVSEACQIWKEACQIWNMAFRVSASLPINAKNGRRSLATLATGFVGAMLVIAVVMQPSDSSARAELSADIAQGSWARDHCADPSELPRPMP